MTTGLTFDAEKHEYRYKHRRVPSVTQVIGAVLGHGWMAADWYLQRGTAVHACAALIARGVGFRNDPQIDGQVQALRRFFSEVQPEVISCESPVFSYDYRFAGTTDLICKISGVELIVDFKASIDKDRTPLQLGGYSIMTGIRKGAGVEIRADGKYRMTETMDLRKASREFLALRAVYGIMDRMNTLPKG